MIYNKGNGVLGVKLQKRKNRIITWTLLIAVAVMFLLPQSLVKAEVTAPEGIMEHHAYAVIDARTGELLLGDMENERIYPASTAKLMTAIVLVENSTGDQVITITSDMIKQIPTGISKYGLKSGQAYTMDTLLHMILMSSAGDAAVCAAIGVFGSVETCVDAMNEKAQELGLQDTHFDNTIGLDIGDDYNEIYSTAYEIAYITRYAMSINKIANIVAKQTYHVKQADGTSGRAIGSTNCFYFSIDYSKDLYKIIGSKTGTTSAAGYVFSATAVDKKGREVICTYMGKVSKYQTFVDIRKLLDATYKAQQSNDIALSIGKQVIKTEVRKIDENYEKGKKIDLGAYLVDSKTKLVIESLGGNLTYKSSDKSVVGVTKDGIVKIKGPGTATVTIKASKTPYYKETTKEIQVIITEKEEAAEG